MGSIGSAPIGAVFGAILLLVEFFFNVLVIYSAKKAIDEIREGGVVSAVAEILSTVSEESLINEEFLHPQL